MELNRSTNFWEQPKVLFAPEIINGKTEKTKGIKYDQNKNRYDLIPPDALDEIVKNLTYGSQKYADENWRLVDEPRKRYFAAAQRHLWAWKRGEIYDPENNIHHLAAAAVNIMFILDIELTESNKKNSSENT